MAKELILIPKAKYELLTKENDTDREALNREVLPNEEPQIDTLEKTIVYAVPKNTLRKAMGLWNYIKDRKGSILDWKDNGEVIVHGQSIANSHLIDLLKHTVSAFSKTEPVGYEQFMAALKELHTPNGFVAHKMSNQFGEGFVKGKAENGPPGRKPSFRWIPY